MQFTAEQVWACAAAAQRINGGYLKEDQRDHHTGLVVKTANKLLVKDWLRTNNYSQITAADTAEGIRARNHFKSYTLLAIAGRLNEFQTTAMQLAAKEEFTGRDMYDFAVISCLPSVSLRDAANAELKREIYTSEQLHGAEGDRIQGEVTVINTRFNPDYNKHKIRGRMGESFVDFWFGSALEGTVKIKAKIKSQRGDKTTQLNYVKILG
ncbi:MAG: hypothetical protein JW384_01355 [Nitrosomonadaceae bacterium]|nr:hypothetical protein [Nitrosomonadaceae bacterium]